MAVLQTILIVVLVYYGLKLLLKWLAPRILKYAARKTQEHFNERFGQYQQQQKGQSSNGQAIFKNRSSNTSDSSKKVGEYIDFEEIE